MNTDALTNKIWSEPCFYYFLLYLQKLLFQLLKSDSFKSFSIQSTAQSFSWFFLIARTSYRATTGTGHSAWENTAISESPAGGPLLLPFPVPHNACSLLPSKEDESCTFFFPILSVISLCAKLEEQNHLKSFLSSENHQKANFHDPAGSINLSSYRSPLSQEPLHSLISMKRYLNSPHAFCISSDWCPLLWVTAKENCMFIREARISHFSLSLGSPSCPLPMHIVLQTRLARAPTAREQLHWCVNNATASK